MRHVVSTGAAAADPRRSGRLLLNCDDAQSVCATSFPQARRRPILDVLLRPRTLYVMHGVMRWEYTHEVLDGLSERARAPIARATAARAYDIAGSALRVVSRRRVATPKRAARAVTMRETRRAGTRTIRRAPSGVLPFYRTVSRATRPSPRACAAPHRFTRG